MFDLLFRMVNQALVVGCCFSLILVLVSLAGLLRLLPALMPYLRRAVRALFVLSFRLYRLVLVYLYPYAREYLGVDIVAGWPRVVATSLLSVVIGVTFFMIARWPVTVWSVGPCVLHGLVVGLAWGELEAPPDGLRLGVKAE